jgi:hypothetical protein
MGNDDHKVTDTQRVRFLLAAFIASVYFTLVLAMALIPGPFAATLTDGIVSAGMLAAMIMILLVFGAMGAFVRWVDRRTRR